MLSWSILATNSWVARDLDAPGVVHMLMHTMTGTSPAGRVTSHGASISVVVLEQQGFCWSSVGRRFVADLRPKEAADKPTLAAA